MAYLLHYAPDNASLIVRLALEHRGIAYRTQLVDRMVSQQKSAAYRALNPLALIPTLETPQGPLFETGAILLWLADTHGGLGPAPDAPDRGDFLKWLFYTANTVHPALRMLFYPHKFIAAEHAPALHSHTIVRVAKAFQTLEDIAQIRPPWLGGTNASALDFYVAALMRWPALYPTDASRDWFDICAFPALYALCERVETLPCCAAVQSAEGMAPRPFTAPTYPSPPEGSAL